MAHMTSGTRVPEDLSRLILVEHRRDESEIEEILQSLNRDLVVLVKNVDAAAADRLMQKVAGSYGLSDALELQAGLASFQGHRRSIGRYFMSVNSRDDYQFIPAHSEGTSFIGMQLSAFFCYENSTDGGETILMNIDDSSDAWPDLREGVKRGKMASRSLTPQEIARIRGLHRLNMPADVLRDDDQILQERQTEIPGLTVFYVLAKPKKTYSRILRRDLNSLWDSVSSIDGDSAAQYADMLKECGMLKEPPGGIELQKMDATSKRHVWRSGVDYSRIFKCKVTLKLGPGDFVIQNNLTWTHSANNWTPGSGTRKVAASFA